MTPTLKAGILMTDNCRILMKTTGGRHTKQLLSAFTFVEVIIALTIVSIAMVSLIRLHIINVNMANAAELTQQATFLAQQKIDELLASDFDKCRNDRGSVEYKSQLLNWNVQVEDDDPLQLKNGNLAGLKKVSVEVAWRQGTRQKNLQMFTYFADRKLP